MTVATVLGLENVLDRTEGFTRRLRAGAGPRPGHVLPAGVRGAGRARSRGGGGSAATTCRCNNLVVDGRVAATTPCFLGADPAASPLLGGATLRPLGAAEDLARELVRSLRPELAARAVLLPRAPDDIVGGQQPPRRPRAWSCAERPLARRPPHTAADALEYAATGLDGRRPAGPRPHRRHPRACPGAELDAAQRELLHGLLATYLDRVPAGVSPLPRYDDPTALDAVHVAWAGSTTPGEPHYYRLQGPRLLVEWDNTQRDVNHAHAVWRDPESDFGLDVLAAHRAAHHA